ncbi:hypothetical protein EYC84_011360 [Monilinia fructicola]|uniref:Copper homeostasis protein cutC homolog n=1 Tax=Monilinia fructicola TaxID=38448 RepID=A0A5M9J9A1_MONFR|nr:hypothetical protein EYC84_011360 [Monilinia fructicola]
MHAPHPNIPHLEIATFTRPSALLALESGAQRIELCSHKEKDGLTPDVQDFLSVSSAAGLCGDGKVDGVDKEKVDGSLPDPLPKEINVMIRPIDNSSPGSGPNQDFRVGDEVFERMKGEMRRFRDLGASGFVFGILKDSDEDSGGERGKGQGGLIVDKERCAELIKIAREGKHGDNVRCTFHRAFDRIDVARMGDQLEILTTLNFTSLLTSGGAVSAIQGIPQIAKLVRQAAGRIEIIVGGGVRSGNLGGLVLGTGAEWFHSSAVTGEGEDVDGDEVRRLREALGKV